MAEESRAEARSYKKGSHEKGSHKKPEIIGVVLAGGRSTRMGRDKALMRYGGESQVERAARVLASLCPRVLVSVRPDQARRPEFSRFDVVIDDPANEGPAAGLLAAWRQSPGAALLVLAVDLPRVDGPLLGRLLEARDADRVATAFEHADGTLEPLCTLWEPAAFEIVRARARNSGASLRKVLEESQIRRVRPPDPACLWSVNTPEEDAALRGS